MPNPEFCLSNHCQMIINKPLILHTLFCFSRRLCYSYISYSFELEKGMDGKKLSWVEILKDSVEHQNLSHYFVHACSSQNQNKKRGLTYTNCIHILQASHHFMCSEVIVILNHKSCKNCANGFLHCLNHICEHWHTPCCTLLLQYWAPLSTIHSRPEL
jgi:hypothetical protein